MGSGQELTPRTEGVDDSKAASFYLGKRIAYVYRGKREIRGSKIRVIWGKVTRTHGMAATHITHTATSASRRSSRLTENVAQATRASYEHNSSTTSHPRASAPWCASCSTPARYERRGAIDERGDCGRWHEPALFFEETGGEG